MGATDATISTMVSTLPVVLTTGQEASEATTAVPSSIVAEVTMEVATIATRVLEQAVQEVTIVTRVPEATIATRAANPGVQAALAPLVTLPISTRVLLAPRYIVMV